MIDRDTIEHLALENGFKLKEQPDGAMALNPYVFDFAQAIAQKAAEAEREACAEIARNEWRTRKNLHDQEGQPQDIRNMHQAGMQSAALINLAIRKRGTGGAG